MGNALRNEDHPPGGPGGKPSEKRAQGRKYHSDGGGNQTYKERGRNSPEGKQIGKRPGQRYAVKMDGA